MGMDEPTPEPIEIELKTLWEGFGRGDVKARDRLLALHYDEMRRVARRVLRDEGARRFACWHPLAPGERLTTESRT